MSNMTRLTANSIPWADTVRGFAMVLIVFGHTIGYSPALRPLTIYLSSFYVPLFFVVSGYLFDPNPQESILAFMRRKAMQILIPYYIFALLSLMPFFLFSGEVQTVLSSHQDIHNPLIHCLLHVFYASGHNGGLAQNSPLWFLPCYYVVIVLAKLAYGKVHVENKYTSTGLALLFLFIGYIVYRQFNYPMPYGLETALIMVYFFFLGRQVRVLHWGLQKITPYMTLVFLVLGYVFHLFNGKISCMNNNYGESFVAFVAAATCTAIGYLTLFRCLRPLPLLSTIGVHTIPFLVMHKMPIVFFQAKVAATSHLLRFGTGPEQLFTAIAVAAITMCLCWLVYRVLVHWVPWAFGE